MRMVKVDIVIPVYNEEVNLEKNINILTEWLKNNFKYEWIVTIADNGSTDNTKKIAKDLDMKNKKIILKEITSKGRGIALRESWLSSTSDICAFMDIDLSTELEYLNEIIYPIVELECEICCGSRWMSSSNVKRGLFRGILSWSYNFILQTTLGLKIKDSQIGFKAIKTDTAKKVIPLIKDNEWFFDTELLLISQKNDLKIKQIPVIWIDHPKSTVVVLKTVKMFLRNVWRMKKDGIPLLTNKN